MNERHRLLGLVAETSSVLEVSLRMTFSALLGSKYAAVVGGGQSVGWLIGSCEAIVRVHREIPPDGKASILAALGACRVANDCRSRLLHDAWGTGPGDEMVTIRSARGTHRLNVTARDLDEISSAVDAIAEAQAKLYAVVASVLGLQSLEIEGRLRAEERRAGQEPQ